MKLFNRQRSVDTPTPTVPPELQPYYATGPTGWQRYAGWIGVGIAVLLILGLGLFWALRDNTPAKHPAPAPRVQQSPQSNTPTAPSGTPSQTPASGSTNSGTVQTPSGNLPNTGG